MSSHLRSSRTRAVKSSSFAAMPDSDAPRIYQVQLCHRNERNDQVELLLCARFA
jgi:hypothetical protein